MKSWLGLGLCFLVAGCSQEQNVYDMSAADVFSRLSEVKTVTDDPPFADRQITVRRTAGSRIRWNAQRMGETYYCAADITPVEESRTRVNVSCGGDGELGPIAGSQWRPFVIELVDSTLRGRPYSVDDALWIAGNYPPDPNDAIAASGAKPGRQEAVNRAVEEYERTRKDRE